MQILEVFPTASGNYCIPAWFLPDRHKGRTIKWVTIPFRNCGSGWRDAKNAGKKNLKQTNKNFQSSLQEGTCPAGFQGWEHMEKSAWSGQRLIKSISYFLPTVARRIPQGGPQLGQDGNSLPSLWPFWNWNAKKFRFSSGFLLCWTSSANYSDPAQLKSMSFLGDHKAI